MGFEGVFPDRKEFPNRQVLYTFNHNSYLDIFLITSVGLSNIRYLLSEKTLVYVPLVISAKAIGTKYVPHQKHAERRLNFFTRITGFLKRKKVSMVGSAEGVHAFQHGIARFNRGVFHMALEAKIPVVALYIHIPKENNVFKNNDAKGGKLKLEIIGEVETNNWCVENLDSHIQEVRAMYVDRFNALNPNEKTV
jgi:putative phosphoserine phosphatase/1-acylglycerol-3-phosphate O-acyltransferase